MCGKLEPIREEFRVGLLMHPVPSGNEGAWDLSRFFSFLANDT